MIMNKKLEDFFNTPSVQNIINNGDDQNLYWALELDSNFSPEDTLQAYKIILNAKIPEFQDMKRYYFLHALNIIGTNFINPMKGITSKIIDALSTRKYTKELNVMENDIDYSYFINVEDENFMIVMRDKNHVASTVSGNGWNNFIDKMKDLSDRALIINVERFKL